MTGRLAGKVAVVSGGARGMGASHVRALVDEGAKVVFGDILDAEGEAVAKDVGDAARYVHLDVTQPDDWERVVATAVDAFGGVDILVNNAGIINVGLIEDYELSEWHRILDINLTGVFLGIRAVVPADEGGRPRVDHQHLVDRGDGRHDRLPRLYGHQVRRARADEIHRS